MKSAIVVFIFLTLGFSLAHAEITCHECGAEWPDDANFCGLCGAPLLRHKVVKTGDTLYLIDLIESGRWAEYGEMIEFSGCSIDEGILTIGGNGYLKVAVGDRSWRDYEISGEFFLLETYEKSKSHLKIFVHNDPREKQYGSYGREMVFVKDRHKFRLHDFIADTTLVISRATGNLGWTWEFNFGEYEISREGPIPEPEIWHDFRLVAEGFSVTMYVNGDKSVSADDLSCRTGGFSVEPHDYKVYFKDLKVKINKMGE
jgi:ribosomal protein L40E